MRSLRELVPAMPLRLVGALVACSLVFAVVLAEAYRMVGWWPMAPWLAAAVVHSVLALGIGIEYARREPRFFRVGPLVAYGPAVLVLVGCSALALASRTLAPANLIPPASEVQWAWILWVPLVEELVFRAGVSQFFRRWAPPFWAVWFASLVFALVHSDPTLSRVLAGQVGLPLGPFLLGLCCDSLVGLTRRIFPSVALHAACNASVAIFGMLDARWLHWLGLLYS